MANKFKNKEEAMAFLQKKKCLDEKRVYDDWYFQSLKVDVCDIYDNELVCTVTKSTGVWLQEQIAKDNTKVYRLGDVSMRGYAMRRFVFRRGRFIDLSEWSKKACLVENPDIFEKYERNFSPALKEYIGQLKISSRREKNGQK